MKRFVSFLAAWLCLTGSSATGQREAPDPLADLRRETIEKAPFAEGEETRYIIYWKPMLLIPTIQAGEVTFTAQKTKWEGEDSYRFSARAESAGIFKTIAGLEVRDYIESIVSLDDFRTRRFLYQTRHGSRQRDLEVRMDYRAGRRLVTELDVATTPPRLLRNQNLQDLPPRLADTLSVFFLARLKKLAVGDRFTLDLNDQTQVKQLNVEVVRSERVKVELGRFRTVKVSTTGGFLRKEGDFHVWYTDDDLHLPIKFEADAKYGKIFGHLIQLRSPHLTKARVRISGSP